MTKHNQTELNQTELSEDMELVGPGQMLKEARIALKLTEKEVAEKLNLTVAAVNCIENDEFNCRLPTTYTRGYLKNYAKLVHVVEDDVLDSYELLGVAAVQQAEMQSFSQITKKQAENSRLMWFSYLVLFFLIALTVMWWQQEHQQDNSAEQLTKSDLAKAQQQQSSANKTNDIKVLVYSKDTAKLTDSRGDGAITDEVAAPNLAKHAANEKTVNEEVGNIGLSNEKPNDKVFTNNTINSDPPKAAAVIDDPASSQPPVLSALTFTFSGDCWVNIYDASGERIAWGIKKADYVMKITGQAPFTITLGKPELVSINFNGNDVDMSSFGSGNIAKFTLPRQP
jgi:cytoskeleton protein RodZ